MLDRCPEYPLYPDASLDLSPYRRALVLAPHPDDEIYGCGGLLRLLIETGAEVSVLVITDGCQGGAGPAAEVRAIRAAESRAAAGVIGLQRLRFLGLDDRSLAFDEALITAVRCEIEEVGPDLLLAPALTERHPDHQVVALVAVEAARQNEHPMSLAFYEVSATLVPNALVDISSVLPFKDRAMQCFASQESLEPYCQRILGLNRYRAYSLGSQVIAAEAFQVIAREQLRGKYGALLQPVLELRWAQRLALDPAQLPLVSVIIPSADRPCLVQALASVAAQTYPRIEILIVDTTGGRHRELPERVGHCPVRLLVAPTAGSRGAAANTGLDAARGEELILLDEEGIFFPHHIERLVGARIEHPDYLAAASDAEVLGGDGVWLATAAQAWSREGLLGASWVAAEVLLFSRALVREGCRFEDDLAPLEAWDFFLQLAQHTHFYPVAGISAQSHRTQVDTQVGDHSEALRQAVLRKWRVPETTAPCLDGLGPALGARGPQAQAPRQMPRPGEEGGPLPSGALGLLRRLFGKGDSKRPAGSAQGADLRRQRSHD